MREWLTVIIGLLILGVVLDGIRRMRQAHRNTLRMPRRKVDSSSTDDIFSSELPNGGARVKPRQGSGQEHNAEDRAPRQVALNLDEHVPTLMEVEPTSEAPKAGDETSRPRATPKATPSVRVEPTLSAENDDLDEDHPDVVLGLVPTKESAGIKRPARPERSKTPERPEKAEARGRQEEASPRPDPEEVLVINVMAPAGEYLYGDLLLDTVLEQGMRFGEMSIFHHHEQPNGSGALLYSMANMVVPGTFDLETMRDFKTPGVSLFMTLPSETNSSRAFEAMLATAQAIARELGGELKDENRSVMTAQTIEHYRSRIKEFERKQLSKAPL